jgi:hypothetical protein
MEVVKRARLPHGLASVFIGQVPLHYLHALCTHGGLESMKVNTRPL